MRCITTGWSAVVTWLLFVALSACGSGIQTTQVRKNLDVSVIDYRPQSGAAQSLLDELSKQGVKVMGKQCAYWQSHDASGGLVIGLYPEFVVIVEIDARDADKATAHGYTLVIDDNMTSARLIDCAEIGQSIH